MSASLNVHVAGLREAMRKVPKEAELHAAQLRIIKRCGLRLVAEIQKRVPRKTGQLFRSIQILNVNYENANVEVGSTLSYAPWVDEGTGIFGPYGTEIFPTTALMLVFPGDSGTVFATSVAGQVGQHFMRDAVRPAYEHFPEEVAFGAAGLFDGNIVP